VQDVQGCPLEEVKEVENDDNSYISEIASLISQTQKSEVFQSIEPDHPLITRHALKGDKIVRVRSPRKMRT
jgi:hypothetical protein